jgi:hypothetical protein
MLPPPTARVLVARRWPHMQKPTAASMHNTVCTPLQCRKTARMPHPAAPAKTPLLAARAKMEKHALRTRAVQPTAAERRARLAMRWVIAQKTPARELPSAAVSPDSALMNTMSSHQLATDRSNGRKAPIYRQGLFASKDFVSCSSTWRAAHSLPPRHASPFPVCRATRLAYRRS